MQILSVWHIFTIIIAPFSLFEIGFEQKDNIMFQSFLRSIFRPELESWFCKKSEVVSYFLVNKKHILHLDIPRRLDLSKFNHIKVGMERERERDVWLKWKSESEDFLKCKIQNLDWGETESYNRYWLFFSRSNYDITSSLLVLQNVE